MNGIVEVRKWIKEVPNDDCKSMVKRVYGKLGETRHFAARNNELS